MCNQICGNCAYWDVENGLNLPNPRKEFRTLVPLIRYGMCMHKNASSLSDDRHMLPLMDADGSCDRYHEGFSPSHVAVMEDADYRATFQERHPIRTIGAA